jgi:glycosyltransferase involved in cell wall biosynthesis
MTVSVCIPTYNQAQFLEKAIRSAQSQTYPILEIIVSDDASTDNTSKVLAKLQSEISNLKVIGNKKNQGITSNVNCVLRAAKGDLIVRLDSDDFLETDYVLNFVDHFRTNSNLGFGHAAVKEVNQFDTPLRTRRLFRSTSIQSSTEALKEASKGYRVAANIIIFRRNVLERVGFIRTTINFAEDYYLTSDITAHGFDNIYLQKILSNYRVWTDLKQTRSKRKLAEIRGLHAVYRDVLMPAFIKNGFSVELLQQRMASVAINQSDCLAWSIYNKAEKQELLFALNSLSNRFDAKLVYFFYRSGLGFILLIPKYFVSLLKGFIKSILKQ